MVIDSDVMGIDSDAKRRKMDCLERNDGTREDIG